MFKLPSDLLPSSTFVPLFLIDGAGRRALLKWTFPLMALSLFLSGGGLFVRDLNEEAGQRMFYAFTIIFTFVSPLHSTF